MSLPRHARPQRQVHSHGVHVATATSRPTSRRTIIWAGAMAAIVAVTAFSITTG